MSATRASRRFLGNTNLAAFLLCLICLSNAGPASAQSGGSEGLRQVEHLGPVLATLEGRWKGEGELLDRPATFSMNWVKSLNGRYLRLEFGNAYTDVDPIEGVLEAHAYYLLGGTTLTGRWIDSRGMMLSIEAEIVDSTLVAHWSGEENGRTEYHVIDEDTVEVTDYVHVNGEYYPFAKARYQRVK